MKRIVIALLLAALAVPAFPQSVQNMCGTPLASAAINGTGTTSYTIYPGVTVASNVAVSQVLPRLWRVSLAGTSTPSMTFSVDVCYAN